MFSQDDVDLLIEYVISLSGKEMNMLKMLMSNGVSATSALDQVVNTRTQKIEAYLRNATNSWKQAILERANNTCYVSDMQRPNGLEVHHVSDTFDNIVRKAFKECNIDYRPFVYDYNPRELKALNEAVANMHQSVTGVVMLKEVHQLFHKEYGQNNAGMPQINELRDKFRKGIFTASIRQ